MPLIVKKWLPDGKGAATCGYCKITLPVDRMTSHRCRRQKVLRSRPKVLVTECIHRSAQPIRQEQCNTGCAKGVRIKVYSCAKFNCDCVIGRQNGIRSCNQECQERPTPNREMTFAATPLPLHVP